MYIENRPLHDLTQLPIRAALDFFRTLRLEGSRGEIADKIVKEIQPTGSASWSTSASIT